MSRTAFVGALLVVFAGIAIFDTGLFGRFRSSVVPPADVQELGEKSASEISPKTLLESEKYFAALTKKFLFIAPSTDIFEDLREQKKWFTENSSSSFLLEYRDRLFLLTAAHVWSGERLMGKIDYVYVRDTEKWVRLPEKEKRKLSNILDVAALDMTDLRDILPRGGTLASNTSDLLEKKSELATPCNPLKFPEVFTGYFAGIEKDGTGRIIIDTYGGNTRAGCSGSPVVDKSGVIRGILVEGSILGKRSWAVPGSTIALFLDEKFFK